MRIYTSVRVHMIISTIAILLIIWLSHVAGLWDFTVALVMTLIAAVLLIATYFFLMKIPKHDNDLHYRDKYIHKHHH